MSEPNKKARVLLLLAAIFPLLTLVMISEDSVNFPFSDQWEIVPLLVKKAQGTLTFADLFALAHEYREFFPNLVFVYLAQVTHWDVRYEMMISFVLACAVCGNLYLLGRKTLQGRITERGVAFVLACMLIFSPVQYENWLMGQQLIFFVPIVCITTCLLICYSEISIWKKVVLCTLLASVSSFSSANGLLCWIVVFPVLVVGTASESKKPVWVTPLWLAGFTVCVALYFYGFQRPAYLPPVTEVFKKPPIALAYLLALLGSPLTGNNRYLTPATVLLGLALAAMFVLASRVYVSKSTETAVKRGMLCWLMIGAYSVATAILVTFGRLGYGIQSSLSSRYTTFCLYLVVALIYLVTMLGGPVFNHERQRRLLTRRTLFALAGLLIILHMFASAVSLRAVTRLKVQLRQMKACSLFVDAIEDACPPSDLVLLPENLRERLHSLEQLGFLRPGLVQSKEVQNFAGSDSPQPGFGSFLQLSRQGDTFVAYGTARLPRNGEPADSVLLTYTTDEGKAILFTLAEMNYNGDILKRFLSGDPNYVFYWHKTFPKESLPATAMSVSAWVFDTDLGKAYKLEGTHSLR